MSYANGLINFIFKSRFILKERKVTNLIEVTENAIRILTIDGTALRN